MMTFLMLSQQLFYRIQMHLCYPTSSIKKERPLTEFVLYQIKNRIREILSARLSPFYDFAFVVLSIFAAGSQLRRKNHP